MNCSTRHGLRETPEWAEAHPDLLGLWAAARLRAHGRSREAVREVEHRFAALARDAREGGVCLTPLASAELLRAWIEEGEHVRTPREALEAR